MTTRLHLATAMVLLAFALALAACASTGSQASESGAAQPASGADEPATSATDEPAESATASEQGPIGEAGSFAVNGMEFGVTNLNRCIPSPDSPENLDLQPIARGAQLNLYLVGGTVEVSVQGSAIEDAFGSLSFGQDPVVHESTVSDDRWTGSATVGDSFGSGETVDITWDVMVPSEIRDCSL